MSGLKDDFSPLELDGPFIRRLINEGVDLPQLRRAGLSAQSCGQSCFVVSERKGDFGLQELCKAFTLGLPYEAFRPRGAEVYRELHSEAGGGTHAGTAEEGPHPRAAARGRIQGHRSQEVGLIPLELREAITLRLVSEVSDLPQSKRAGTSAQSCEQSGCTVSEL